MRQGATGHVRRVDRDGRALVEKRMADPLRHDTEVAALRALSGTALPVPELVEVEPGAILMTLMPGDRLDELPADDRLEGLRASATLLRELHRLPCPAGLSPAPDNARIVRRYRDAGGPALPLRIPPLLRPVLCHGDWTAANLLAVDGSITAIVDWEAAHVGDPIREVSRAAWGASLNDPRAFSAIVDAYGADQADAWAWAPLHAAELWLWFAEAGPVEYLRQLTDLLLRSPFD